MLRIAICDDNTAICSEVENMVLEYQEKSMEDIDVNVFHSGKALIEFIEKEHEFDLIFLDIEIGDMTGVEVGSKIRMDFDDHISKIVFMTSKNGYEQALFDIQPLNFIKKPIAIEKAHRCLDLSLKLLGRENEVFEYKKEYDIVRVKMKEILYFEKIGRKTKIITNGGEDSFNESLVSVGERLPSTFVKPHGSFIIHFEKIQKIQKDTVIMMNQQEIPVSQRGLKTLHALLLHRGKG